MLSITQERLAPVFLCLLMLIGCSNSSNPRDSSPRVATQGNVQGIVYLIPAQDKSHPSSGQLVIAGQTPPAQDAEPVAGAELQVNGVQQGETDLEGVFRFTAEAGPLNLQVRHGDLFVNQAVTVVADSTVVIGDSQMSREQAWQIVQDSVIAQEARPSTLLVLASHQPLPAGTVLGATDGSDDVSALRTRLNAPAWLFYVDRYFTQGHGHPTLHVLVDDASGALTVLERQSAPSLNQMELWVALEDQVLADVVLRPTEDPYIYAPKRSQNSPAMSRSGSAPAPAAPKDHVEGCTESKTFGLYITGATENSFLEATTRFSAALSADVVREIVPTNNGDFSTLYANAYNALNAQMGPCDRLIIYIASHGYVDDDGNGLAAFMYERQDRSLGDNRKQSQGPAELASPMTDLKACHLQLIVDACYSGSMADQFQTYFNRRHFRHVDRFFVASTDSTTTATFENISTGGHIFGTTTGGKFSNELIEAGVVGGSPAEVSAAIDELRGDGGVFTYDSYTHDQNSQYLHLPATESCAADGSSVGGGSGGVDVRDSDEDSWPDNEDNCPNTFNPEQLDGDGDGIGDECDNCRSQSNADQSDGDRDGHGDACDNCPQQANADQADNDQDGIGDACDNCVATANSDQNDGDSDSVGDVCDNCPGNPNPDQANHDNDEFGDVCDMTRVVVLDHSTGNIPFRDSVDLTCIQNGTDAQPDACLCHHLHGEITITGQSGSFEDPNSNECGHGCTTDKPYSEIDYTCE